MTTYSVSYEISDASYVAPVDTKITTTDGTKDTTTTDTTKTAVTDKNAVALDVIGEVKNSCSLNFFGTYFVCTINTVEDQYSGL